MPRLFFWLPPFFLTYFFHLPYVLFCVAGASVLPTFISAIVPALKFKITINTFNVFAVVVAFAVGEPYSAGFIALMLTSARLLDYYAEARTENTVEALMRLKPLTAFLEEGGVLREVKADSVKSGDVVVVKGVKGFPWTANILYRSRRCRHLGAFKYRRVLPRAHGNCRPSLCGVL
jgi:cation transport ATPase